jgi:hypothetical protein
MRRNAKALRALRERLMSAHEADQRAYLAEQWLRARLNKPSPKTEQKNPEKAGK